MSFSSHTPTGEIESDWGVCWNLDPGYKSVLGKGRRGLWLCGLGCLQEMMGVISLALRKVKSPVLAAQFMSPGRRSFT